jgi:hypothetical protein
MFRRAWISQIWPHRMAERGGLWPPNGHRLCQERQDIAPLATGFAPSAPDIARAQAVLCQPNRVKSPISTQENDGKISKITPKLAKNPRSRAAISPISLGHSRSTPADYRISVRFTQEKNSFWRVKFPKTSGIWVFCPNFFENFSDHAPNPFEFSSRAIPYSFRKIRNFCMSPKKM